MQEIARQLRAVIATVQPKLSKMNHHDVAHKPAPNEWSKKEILGHLIDSAANNHQRFVRAVYHAAADFPPYEQEKWVRIQRYNQTLWSALVTLWAAYNDHLGHVIECLPEDAESSPCNIGMADPVPLAFVAADYLRHLRLHLEDILEKEPKDRTEKGP